MSVKEAQGIVNQIEERTGISLVSFNNGELEWLKDQLEEFLDLEIDTDELMDPSDVECEDSDAYGSMDEEEEDCG